MSYSNPRPIFSSQLDAEQLNAWKKMRAEEELKQREQIAADTLFSWNNTPFNKPPLDLSAANLDKCAEAFDRVNRLATLEGEWYKCHTCGHKLARRVQGCICTTEQAEKSGAVEIKCKHKNQGKCCDTLNILQI